VKPESQLKRKQNDLGESIRQARPIGSFRKPDFAGSSRITSELSAIRPKPLFRVLLLAYGAVRHKYYQSYR